MWRTAFGSRRSLPVLWFGCGLQALGLIGDTLWHESKSGAETIGTMLIAHSANYLGAMFLFVGCIVGLSMSAGMSFPAGRYIIPLVGAVLAIDGLILDFVSEVTGTEEGLSAVLYLAGFVVASIGVLAAQILDSAERRRPWPNPGGS